MKKAWSILPEEWKPILTERGMRAFRADQILQALYRDYITDWDQATTLPKDFREQLKVEFPITKTQTLAVSKSSDGTQKLLLGLEDGESVETVLIPATGRFTQCISTQVGCGMGCAFCASGANGVVRSLAADEIVAEYMAGRALGEITNIVVMGMGEPFANYDETMRALKLINAGRGPNLGARHITLSTCGVVPGFAKLAAEGIQFELSVSRECAEELARQVKRVPMAKVNLIPLSPVSHRPDFKTPDERTMLMFLDVLMKNHVQTMLRRSRGKDADAACGQLRLRRQSSK